MKKAKKKWQKWSDFLHSKKWWHIDLKWLIHEQRNDQAKRTKKQMKQLPTFTVSDDRIDERYREISSNTLLDRSDSFFFLLLFSSTILFSAGLDRDFENASEFDPKRRLFSLLFHWKHFIFSSCFIASLETCSRSSSCSSRLFANCNSLAIDYDFLLLLFLFTIRCCNCFGFSLIHFGIDKSRHNFFCCSLCTFCFLLIHFSLFVQVSACLDNWSGKRRKSIVFLSAQRSTASTRPSSSVVRLLVVRCARK